MRARSWGSQGAVGANGLLALSLLLSGMSGPAACTKKDDDKPLAPDVEGGPEIGWREGAQRVERAPISLTASDGTGLVLVSVKARTVIEDPLAFTELHLVFNNPEPRRREGRFEITLPHEAAISRFAMRVSAGWQEGEVVERRRAQQVYEDFLHRKQDPALLEKEAGNEFAARVFPIEANADKEIIVSYSEELPRSAEPYRLLLQGLPTLRELDVEVQVGSSSATGKESTNRARGATAKLTLREKEHEPAGDLEVRLPKQKPVALRNGDLVVARVVPKVELAEAPIDGLTVLFDTSASRALGFGAQIERLAALVAELRERTGKDFDLSVVAFDQDAEQAYRGPASGFGLREQSKLLERDALGASDLVQALTFITREPAGHKRVLLIGDGVITAGADDSTALREAVAKLAAHGVTRLDALGEGGIQDRASLSVTAHAGLPNAGLVLDSRMTVVRLVDKLLSATMERVEVQIAGASFVYPRVLEGVQAGDARIVLAEVPADQPVQIELVGAGAESFETLEAPRPLLQRAIARAKIESMSAELRALRPEAEVNRAELDRKIIELSVQERVVSDQTALLVLETAQDYERFGVAQNALTSILQIGDEGIEVVDRLGAKAGEIVHHDRRPLEIARDEESQGEDDFRARERRAEPEPPTAEGASSQIAAAAPPPPSPSPSGASEAKKREAPSPAKPTDALGSLGTLGGGGFNKGAALQGRGAGTQADDGSALRTRSAEAKSSSMADLNRSARPATRAASGGAVDSLASSESEASNGAAYRPRRIDPETQLEIAAPLEARATVTPRGAQGLSGAEAAAVLRGVLKARAQRCYAQVNPDPSATERIVIELSITDKGTVSDAYVSGGALSDRGAQACVLAAARALRFPKPQTANASVQATVELSMQRAAVRDLENEALQHRPRVKVAKVRTPEIADAYDGVLADVLSALKRNDPATALTSAKAARTQDPGDVIALVALGEALEAAQDLPRAARVYGSIIDLFPSRADLRRMASGRLERLAYAPALKLAIDSYRRAVEQRPDHPSGHRSLAYALMKQGEYESAFAALERGAESSYAADRFEGVGRILREDLAILGAVWVRAKPEAEARVRAALSAHGVDPDHAPSLRFVLSWETDANDVDFHIHDGRGGHAFYQKPKLASGGSLYADITTGYGPECFAIPGRARAYPYVLQAHYFARGPMGYGMGKVQAIEHDGAGLLRITEHPFVIMKDKAFLELARVTKPE